MKSVINDSYANDDEFQDFEQIDTSYLTIDEVAALILDKVIKKNE